MNHALFLHSTGTPSSMWSFVSDSVVPAARRVTVTNLGYPPLQPVPRGAVVTLADDAANALRQLPAEGTFDVVSHSYGGLLALEVMRSLRGRVRSVFLYEPVMFGALANEAGAAAEGVAQAKAFDAHPWFLRDDERGGREAWLEYFIDYWNRPGSFARMQGPARDLALAVGWKMYQEVRAVFFETHDFRERPLPEVPVTLVMGERTTAGAKATVQALARHFPWATVQVLEGTGHMGPLTHPEKVLPVLEGHLRTP